MSSTSCQRIFPSTPTALPLRAISAGGAGTWLHGEKYADKWAAIGRSAAADSPAGFPSMVQWNAIMVATAIRTTKE